MADPTNVKSKILIVEEKQEEASAIESVLRGAGYANIHKVDKAEVKFDKFVTLLQVKYGYDRPKAKEEINKLWTEYEARVKSLA